MGFIEKLHTKTAVISDIAPIAMGRLPSHIGNKCHMILEFYLYQMRGDDILDKDADYLNA